MRLKNLIELKEQLQKKYGKGSSFWQNLSSKSNTPSLHPEDEFLTKVNQFIQENIKALTGLSTSIYIRTLRLYKAKELLQSSDLNISEIAYEVGFKDPNYFSRAFSDEFNTSPSAIRK